VFSLAGSTAVKWLQRWEKNGSAEAKPRGGSVSPLEVHAMVILEMVPAQPDATFVELPVVLEKRGIHTSCSALWRFFNRHNITFKKKSRCTSERGPAANGFASKACLIRLGWYSSQREHPDGAALRARVAWGAARRSSAVCQSQDLHLCRGAAA
jgi:transposase